MNADGEYKWAALFIDHYSKFSVIWPMKNRTGKEVAETLRYDCYVLQYRNTYISIYMHIYMIYVYDLYINAMFIVC